VAVWGTALSKLKALFPSHACKEFNAALPKFNFRWACELQHEVKAQQQQQQQQSL
jgi:hypothetical protein